MSAVMHLAPGVEITLLKRHFAVVTVAVGVVRMPEKGSKLPHTVMRVRWVSDLFGRMSHTILGYVTLLVPNGTSDFKMKWMVFVPSILFLTPWARRPNSLANDRSQISRSGPIMRWRNSWRSPVIGFVTELASLWPMYAAARAYFSLIMVGWFRRLCLKGYRCASGWMMFWLIVDSCFWRNSYLLRRSCCCRRRVRSFDGVTWDLNDDGEVVSVSGGMRCGCGVAAGCVGVGRCTVGMIAGMV